MAKLFMFLAIGAAMQMTVQAASGTCHTSQCRLTASSILRDMDTKADPCVDFNKFACGGFNKREKLGKGEKSNGYFSAIYDQNLELIRSIITAKAPELPKGSKKPTKNDLAEVHNHQKLKDFYGACMDEKRLEKVGRKPLQEQIKKMAAIYPVTTETDATKAGRKSRRTAISKLLGYNMKHGFENFFGIEVNDDTIYHGYKILTFQQSGLGLKKDARYKDAKLVKLYEKVIGEMFYIIQGNGDLKKKSNVPKKWKSVAKDVVAFEKILAGVNGNEKTAKAKNGEINASKNEKEEEGGFGEYWYTIEDLNKMTPALDWKRILTTAFPKDVAIPRQFNVDPRFNMTRLNKAVETSSTQTIQNYFVWTVIRSLGKNLAPSLQTPLQELDRAMPDASSKKLPRWTLCVRSVNKNIGDLAGHFFIQKMFPAKSQRTIKDMIAVIQASFEKNFWKYDWLDAQTRVNAVHKLYSIIQKVGYSTVDPNVGSATSIDAHYKNLTIKANDHFGNHVRASIWSTERKLRSPTQNSIEILAGILRPPFFNVEDPEYLNFGGIGYVVGHELGHAFDDEGRNYDETGANLNWWRESSIKAFDEKSRCFVEQYGNYTITGPNGVNVNVNGTFTLGENIADNSGIKLSFEAWYQRYRSDRSNKKYNNVRLPGLQRHTPEQLFFIQYARSYCGNTTPEERLRLITLDPHSPDKYRINGVVQNSDYFAKAFKCKAGSPMNPVKKCILW
ncbi:hypothetical protein BGZ94_002573 [Podila epigama]|nr:hypothetical protein BGZ94_002573 [Podila epigama]